MIPFASVSGEWRVNQTVPPSRITASLCPFTARTRKGGVKVETVALDVITGRRALEAEPAGLIEEGSPLVDK